MTPDIIITNPNKILFPKSKITKLDIINYYIDISKLMLPFVKDRLLSVIRCHEGINNECFYKKHPNSDNLVNEFKVNEEVYFYIKNETELVNQVQLGTLEFHTWGSTINDIERPNFMVFDLDPDENLSLNILRSATLKVKETLDELNLKSFIKTSGGKGYHIVVPFSKSKNWDTFYDFSQQIALLLENKYPNEFTTNIRKSERRNKIFIDYLRNNKGSTCVAPYSVRAKENAPISCPIRWEDLYKVKPNEINIKNYKKYLNNSWNNFFKFSQILK